MTKLVPMLFIFLILCLIFIIGGEVYAQEQTMPLHITNSTALANERSAFLENVNFDQNGKGNIPTNKLGNGVLNIITSWTDVPQRMEMVSHEKGTLQGATLGFGEGLFLGISRATVGSIELATFLLPPYDQSAMNPKYAVKNPNSDGWKIQLFSW